MESRNTRSFRTFIQQLLHTDEEHQDDSDMFDGVCFLNTHSGGVEYAQGSFTTRQTDSSSLFQLRVDLHNGSNSSSASLVDTRQFLRTFEQIARRVLQQEACRQQRKSDNNDREQEDEAAELTPAFHVGDVVFQLVSASFTTVCAVAHGRTHALIIEKLPFGVLVVLVRHPQTLEHVLPRMNRACASLRR